VINFFWVVLGALGTLGLAAVGDLISEEFRDRLEYLPHAILRLAAHRLDPSKRVTVYVDEWIPELTYILKGDEARPVTRLYHGMRFAFGILVAVRRIDRDLPAARTAADLPQAVPVAEVPPVSFPTATRTEQAELGSTQSSSGQTVPRLLLGAHLRRLREEAVITVDQAAAFIRCSRAAISRLEHGRLKVRERDIADLLSLYGVGPGEERETLMRLARETGAPGWWQTYSDILPNWVEPYFGLEAAASVIREYELQFVPGLLQTEEYARAVIRLGSCTTEEEVARRTEARTSRQQILDRCNPPRLWAIIDENALRRPVGGREVMREQFKHLINMCEHPAVTVQILPLAAGAHSAMSGPFTILLYHEPALPDIVYVEQLTSALYLDRLTEVDAYRAVIEEASLQAEPASKTPALLRQYLANM
jgi:transcriptional regulator with XRE-family HTH domain